MSNDILKKLLPSELVLIINEYTMISKEEVKDNATTIHNHIRHIRKCMVCLEKFDTLNIHPDEIINHVII